MQVLNSSIIFNELKYLLPKFMLIINKKKLNILFYLYTIIKFRSAISRVSLLPSKWTDVQSRLAGRQNYSHPS